MPPPFSGWWVETKTSKRRDCDYRELSSFPSPPPKVETKTSKRRDCDFPPYYRYFEYHYSRNEDLKKKGLRHSSSSSSSVDGVS